MSLLHPEVTPEILNHRGDEYLPGYLGIEVVSIGQGTLHARMPVKKLHVAPNEFLHAASIVALADTSCGYGTIAHLPAGAQSFTTIELKSNHLATVREGSISCIATAQHLGKTTQVWDAVVSDEASGKKPDDE